MRWLIVVIIGGALCLGEAEAATHDEADSKVGEVVAAPLRSTVMIIQEIEFVGLRRIAAAAAQAQIASRAGAALDLRRVQLDVKALGEIGWFDDVRAETESAPASAVLGDAVPGVRLIFRVAERPYLTKVEYVGSRLLSTSQIQKMLEEKHLTPTLGEPANDFVLDRVSKTIVSELASLGHPEARVTLLRRESGNETVSVRYEISDGLHLPVGHIEFVGHPAIASRALQREMHRTQPGLFASWRGKGAFTREGFAEDRASLLIYYQDHGYPEARVGNPWTWVYTAPSRKSALWPFHRKAQRLAVAIPIEAGPPYHVASVDVSPELLEAGGKRGKRGKKLLAVSHSQVGTAYSAKSTEDLRHGWVAVTSPRHLTGATFARGDIEASRTLDPDSHSVSIRIAPSDAPPYMVRRIELRGEHRFSDRYLRRRIALQEGRPFDERALELGLARLAKTGYFRQIHKEDIRVEKNEAAHTVDVTIRIAEAGQQRASLSGGQSQLGNTLGLAYSLFDMLQREELLSAQLDGGPDSLQLMLGLLMEGFLGSRSSLAISIFDNVLRPRLQSSVKGPFYTSQSEGLNASWSYALSQTDSVSLNYAAAHTDTNYSFSLPPSLTGLPAPEVEAKTTSSALGFAFAHEASDNRFSIANSVSGGALGGTENVLRSNEQYAHVFADPLFNRQNAWAFRTTFSGAGSYQGEFPFYARLLSSESQVRGLSPGELGPYAVIPTTTANGNAGYSALPSGANVISAANAEYRVPLGGRVQAVGFFDLGSGWLLPNWLGPTKPVLLQSTNGVLHGSFGLELRWTIPEIQVPIRAYVAVNVLRLNRFWLLPDNSLFRVHNKLFSLGWALGNLF